MPPTTIKITLREQHRRAIDSTLDALDGPFRRSAISDAMYRLTSPRSRPMADRLADAALKELARAGRIQRHGHQHWIKVSQERTLRSGRAVPELTEVTNLALTTRCPRKWLSVDLETGDVWAGDVKGWRRATADERNEALLVLT